MRASPFFRHAYRQNVPLKMKTARAASFFGGGGAVNIAGLSAHKASLATARLKLNVSSQMARDKLTKAKRPGVRGLQGVDRHEEITNGNTNQTVRGKR